VPRPWSSTKAAHHSKMQEFCPMLVGPEWQGFCEGRTVREEAGGGFATAVFCRSKFEISAALLQLCLCTACQVGPDHQVMKGPDRVEIRKA